MPHNPQLKYQAGEKRPALIRYRCFACHRTGMCSARVWRDPCRHCATPASKVKRGTLLEELRRDRGPSEKERARWAEEQAWCDTLLEAHREQDLRREPWA